MKRLTDEQMEPIVGGLNWNKLLCSGYFIGMAAIIGSATIVGGLVVGGLGAAVCELT